MEPSKTQKQITSLGEQLVDSLGKAYDVGPLARWMSHYIAEQIVLAEEATGEARLAAQKRCFDAILKLWRDRAAIPGSGRPFRSFEPIFNVLERLDLKTSSFYGIRLGWSSDQDPEGEVAKIVQQVTSIDETARTLIWMFLSMAVTLCKDKATLGYLKAALGDIKSEDAQVIAKILLDIGANDEPAGMLERDKRFLESLDRFVLLAANARKMLVACSSKESEK